jgi:non-homologous end joining protein Ku
MYISDMIFGVKQHKKYLKEYIEFARVLSATNKVGVGTFVFKERPYPVIVYPFREGLVIRGLFYYNEVEAMPAVTPVTVNETKITLLSQAMALNENEDDFDISIFVNTRVEEEEKLLERVIHGQPLPEVTKAEPMVVSADQDEILRLQQLLAQKKKVEVKSESIVRK